MEEGFWFSALIGLGIGAMYVLMVFLGLRLALRQKKHSFMAVVLGGMALRLFLAVGVIAIIVAVTDVDKVVFLATFLGVFLIGMIVEVVFLHQHSGSADSQHSDSNES